MSTLLRVADVTAHYGRIQALHGVDVEVAQGEAVAIIGANGAGKTTLLRTIAGLLAPTSGTVALEGQDVTGRPAEDVVRSGIVLVPEGRQVFDALSAEDNLLLGGYHRRREADTKADLQRVFELFPTLADRRAQYAGTLSGGEQQMLAIGRAMMAAPRVLLLDEPSLGLAPLIIAEVVEHLLALARSGTTLLLVEQNARAALKVADRGYVLQQGRVVSQGSTRELLEDPRVRAAYLGAAPDPDAAADGSRGSEPPPGVQD